MTKEYDPLQQIKTLLVQGSSNDLGRKRLGVVRRLLAHVDKDHWSYQKTRELERACYQMEIDLLEQKLLTMAQQMNSITNSEILEENQNNQPFIPNNNARENARNKAESIPKITRTLHRDSFLFFSADSPDTMSGDNHPSQKTPFNAREEKPFSANSRKSDTKTTTRIH